MALAIGKRKQFDFDQHKVKVVLESFNDKVYIKAVHYEQLVSWSTVVENALIAKTEKEGYLIQVSIETLFEVVLEPVKHLSRLPVAITNEFTCQDEILVIDINVYLPFSGNYAGAKISLKQDISENNQELLKVNKFLVDRLRKTEDRINAQNKTIDDLKEKILSLEVKTTNTNT